MPININFDQSMVMVDDEETCKFNIPRVRKPTHRPLRERRNFVVEKLSIPSATLIHQHVLLECKERERYLKESVFRSDHSMSYILSLFERNTHYSDKIKLPTETKDINSLYSCKYIPTHHRNVNQIVLFRKDEPDEQSLSKTSLPSLENKSTKRKLFELEEQVYSTGYINKTSSSCNQNKRINLTNASNDLISLDMKVKSTASIWANARLRKQKAQASQDFKRMNVCPFHNRIA